MTPTAPQIGERPRSPPSGERFLRLSNSRHTEKHSAAPTGSDGSAVLVCHAALENAGKYISCVCRVGATPDLQEQVRSMILLDLASFGPRQELRKCQQKEPVWGLLHRSAVLPWKMQRTKD